MLTGVIAHGTGAPRSSTGRPRARPEPPRISRDALFVGYTADLVAGVWFGNDDNSPMNHVTGGTLPARTWHAFMVQATRGMPVKPLPMPEAAPVVAEASSSSPLVQPIEGAVSGLQRLLHAIFGGR